MVEKEVVKETVEVEKEVAKVIEVTTEVEVEKEVEVTKVVEVEKEVTRIVAGTPRRPSQVEPLKQGGYADVVARRAGRTTLSGWRNR